jgi:ferritin
MLPERINNAFNDQIREELFSSYLYLSMHNYCESIGLKGFANWMKVQAQEELFHAIKLQDYINERGGRVTLLAIEQPKTEWNSIEEVMEETYKHEQHITSCFNRIMDLAIEEKDYASHSIIRWYIDEQVEEESSVEDILNRMKLMENSKHGLFMLDRDLGQRTFTWPTGE